MFDTTFIEGNFTKQSFSDHRWLFRPRGNRDGLTHVFLLTYLPGDRRYTLAKRKIVPIEAVEDKDLLAAFEGTLTDKEVADCVASSLDPDDDAIPF